MIKVMTDLNTIKTVLLRNKHKFQEYGITEIGIFGSYIRGE